MARNEEFLNFAREIAVHVASAAPRWVSEEDVPDDELARERTIFEQQADSDKPRRCARRSPRVGCASGSRRSCLLDQKHVNADRYEGRTIEQLRADLSAKTGENVVIRRFARFQVGGLARACSPGRTSAAPAARPEVEEGIWYRTPCLRCARSRLRLKEDGETLVVR